MEGRRPSIADNFPLNMLSTGDIEVDEDEMGSSSYSFGEDNDDTDDDGPEGGNGGNDYGDDDGDDSDDSFITSSSASVSGDEDGGGGGGYGNRHKRVDSRASSIMTSTRAEAYALRAMAELTGEYPPDNDDDEDYDPDEDLFDEPVNSILASYPYLSL